MDLFTAVCYLMKKVALSACLLGNNCRYNAEIKSDEQLLSQLREVELIAFCPEDFCYGTPRPSMDLISTAQGNKALSNLSGLDLSSPIVAYADDFFHKHHDIALFIGKDRSPSCGVRSAKLYDKEKNLLSSSEAGLMSKEALKRGIPSIDAEKFKGIV